MLEREIQHLDELDLRMSSALKLRHADSARKLTNLTATLHALSPQRQLERGYAIVFDGSGKKIVTSSKLPPDTSLLIRFADGSTGVKTV